MKILITGTSQGIGKAIAEKFLEADIDNIVYGIDIQCATIVNDRYHHYIADISKKDQLPEFPFEFDIVINNAGVQNGGTGQYPVMDDIDVNLRGTMNVTEKYAIPSKELKSVLNIASASAHTGAEFPEYSASKGGVLAYTKNVALRVADRGATCNSISPGGVLTDINLPVMENPNLWNQIMDLTPLKRWAEPSEIADWCLFLTVTNRFMTGQDIMIDGGESTNAKFIWC